MMIWCILLFSIVELLLYNFDKIGYQNTWCELGINLLQESEALNKNDDWVSSTIQSLKKASPTSLKISLRSVSQALLCDTIMLLPEQIRVPRFVASYMFWKAKFQKLEMAFEFDCWTKKVKRTNPTASCINSAWFGWVANNAHFSEVL